MKSDRSIVVLHHFGLGRTVRFQAAVSDTSGGKHPESSHQLTALWGEKNSITIRQTVGTIKPCLQHTNRELNSSTEHLYSNGNVHSASTEQVDPLNQELIGHAHSPACQCHNHGHRIDKYLDTLLANQTISDSEATDHCQKVTSQDGGLPELIVARSCLTNHSKASRL